jgi:hypothetical protein
MKGLIFFICSVLLFTSCIRQPEKTSYLEENPAPIIVDYPAGVLIPSEKSFPNYQHKNLNIAEKLFTSRQITLIDSTSKQIVFVKTNGDRITLSMIDLEGKYDIILFNTINNPVPLRISDLQASLDQVFNQVILKKSKANKDNPPIRNSRSTTDSSSLPVHKAWFEKIRNSDKKVIITKADTSAIKTTTRIIPGIQWVEHRLDTRCILKIEFSNDLITYANTDRYFTNGIKIDLQAAWLNNSALQKIMLPYRHNAFITTHLSLVTDMYTPIDTRVVPKLEKDRPYASYLYFGFKREISDPVRKIKLSSKLDLGYLGPYSPGAYMQKIVHKTFPTNDIPVGWETQIKTDVILNYSIQAQKAIVKKKNFILLAGGEIQAGTLYSNAGFGLQLQAGKAEPFFGISENENRTNTEYYFFCKSNIHFVAYNALLQGGIVNSDNIFTLKGSEIQRVVGEAEAGLHVRYKNMGIELAQHYLSPEYKGGQFHKWGRISLLFGL